MILILTVCCFVCSRDWLPTSFVFVYTKPELDVTTAIERNATRRMSQDGVQFIIFARSFASTALDGTRDGQDVFPQHLSKSMMNDRIRALNMVHLLCAIRYCGLTTHVFTSLRSWCPVTNSQSSTSVERFDE